MNQVYTDNKDIAFKKLNRGYWLLKTVLVIVNLFAFYLMVVLVSFSPSDPSWSQTGLDGQIHNLGGKIGSWFADILFFTFGVLAYVLPPIIIFFCWRVFTQRARRNYMNLFSLFLQFIGGLALLLTSCGLAELNIDDFYYFASGGIVGNLLSNVFLSWFNCIGATFALLCVWALGLTIFTGWSWLIIAEKIGVVVLECLTFVFNRGWRDNKNDGGARCFCAAQDYEDDTHYLNDNSLLRSSATMIASCYGKEPAQNGHGLACSDIAACPQDGQISDNSLSTPLISANDTTQMLANILPATSATNKVDIDVERVNFLAENTEAEQKQFSVLPPTYGNQMPPYHFKFSSMQDNLHVLAEDNNELRVSDWSRNLDASFTSYDFTIVQQNNGTSLTFMPAFTASSSDYNQQVKQSIDPAEPLRLKPVHIPTRQELTSQELASYVTISPQQPFSLEKLKEASQVGGVLSVDYMSNPVFSTLDKVVAWDEQQCLEECFTQSLGQQHYPSTTPADNNSDLNTNTTPLSSAADMNRHHGMNFTIPNAIFTPVHHDEHRQSTVCPNDHTRWPVDNYTPWHNNNMPLQHNNHFCQPMPQISAMDSLIHPFLIRHQHPRQKPATLLPTMDLLTLPSKEDPVDMFALEQTARLVEARLADYRVKAEVVDILPGPVITSFELDLAPGIKAARISNLSRDLARSLSVIAVRVVEVIPGKPYVGLELPNKRRQIVYLREVLDCERFRDTSSPLTLVLGKDISGQPVIADLRKMPHLLVAGTTGSGKSVGINAMILSILYKATPKEVRFIMIDPKMLELSVYEGIPHLLTKVVTDMKDATNALRWCVGEMERRYKLMSTLGVRNLAGYNERIEQANAMGRPVPDPFWKLDTNRNETFLMLEKLPYIVVMVDEFADLIMTVGKKVEELIARLAQKARAAGLHLVLATQRPSVDVITGLIKANIPTRIAFTVSSKIDSRTILDQTGAESLLGMGDMLYLAPNSSLPLRVHGAFVRDEEVYAVVNDWKARCRPQYIDNITCAGDEGNSSSIDGDEELDPLFNQAVAFVIDKRRASISGVQRQFRIGYNRAARIVEQMELQGIVSSPGHNGNREVLSPPLQK